ncbi:MAG: hypothetical protein IIA59_01025 [Candidatus Marinimicrobia bacterium]|nr:hypothetical protein [Candidatus Neomarinimicrobiota bacterium]
MSRVLFIVLLSIVVLDAIRYYADIPSWREYGWTRPIYILAIGTMTAFVLGILMLIES